MPVQGKHLLVTVAELLLSVAYGADRLQVADSLRLVQLNPLNLRNLPDKLR